MRKRNSSVAVVLGKAWLAAMLATGMVSGLPGDLHAASIPGDVGEEVTCSIAHRLPANFEVYHVGTYGGTSPLGQFIELDNSGHEVKKADVLVNYPDRAIVLVLSAYDPVVWNLAWVPGSTIVGVVLSGYHGQAIVGIPKSIPLILTTYENQVRKPASSGRHCPYFYTYRVDQEYRKTNDLIMAMTGKEVTRFIAAPPKSIALVGTELPPSFANLMSSPYYALGDFTMVRKPDEVPAGPRGLEELVRRGYLRPATADDIRAWQDSVSSDLKRFDPNARVSMLGRPATYVVLKPVTLPDGLYGGHSASFIIPEGVPMPLGPRGHNTFYLMGNTRCVGPGC